LQFCYIQKSRKRKEIFEYVSIFVFSFRFSLERLENHVREVVREKPLEAQQRKRKASKSSSRKKRTGSAVRSKLRANAMLNRPSFFFLKTEHAV